MKISNECLQVLFFLLSFLKKTSKKTEINTDSILAIRMLSVFLVNGLNRDSKTLSSGVTTIEAKEFAAIGFLQTILQSVTNMDDVLKLGTADAGGILGALMVLAQKHPCSMDLDRKLSHREKEVLRWLAEGQSSKEMASTLGISVRTIESHRERIMDKLNIHTVVGLTKYSLATGLTENPYLK